MQQPSTQKSAGGKSPRGGWLFAALKGALIGTGAILPGISGGVLCVVFGIYRPIMELLAHPFREIKKNFWFFLPIVIGFAVGVLGISKLLQWVLERYETPALWLFIGLIAGTFPSLWKEAGKEGRSKGSLLAGVITFMVMLPFLHLMQGAQALQLEPTLWLWAACGVLWGLGFIVPGLSPSSMFFVLGVMTPMMKGISDLSMPVLIPMGLGLVVCVLALSQGVGWLLNHRYGLTMHIVFGLTVASTVAILPFGHAQSWVDVVVYESCFAVGCLIALWMEKMNTRLETAGEK